MQTWVTGVIVTFYLLCPVSVGGHLKPQPSSGQPPPDIHAHQVAWTHHPKTPDGFEADIPMRLCVKVWYVPVISSPLKWIATPLPPGPCCVKSCNPLEPMLSF